MYNKNSVKKYLRSKTSIIKARRQIKKYIHRIILSSGLIERFEYYDYYNIPFDTSLPMPPTAVNVLEEGCKILASLNISYTLGWGTALGLYRDKALIPHDTDIDVDVYNCLDHQSLISEMEIKGFTIGRYVTFKDSRTAKALVQQLTFYSKDNVVFDLLFWYDNAQENLQNYSEPNHMLTYKKSFLTHTEMFEYGGYQYRMPHDLEHYLESLYGESWRVPKVQKGDWKDDCVVIQKIG